MALRRRYGRRRIMRTIARRSRRVQVYKFHRWVTALPVYSSIVSGPGVNFDGTKVTYAASTGIISVGTTVNQTEWDLSAAFSLNDIPNVSEFQSLFDQYKLCGVKVQWKLIGVPENNTTANSNTANFANFYPTIWYAPDHDDNGPLTLGQIKEYEKVKHKVLRPNKEVSCFLKPTSLMQVYNSTTTAGYACNYKRPWLDIAVGGGVAVPHYGLKFVVDFEGLQTASGIAPTQGFQIKMNAKYYFMCKNVR